MAVLGMDTQGMDQMPMKIIDVTEQLRTAINQAFQQWSGVKWEGTDKNNFVNKWETETNAVLSVSGQKLGDLATELRKNIIEQNAASDV